MKYQYRDYDSYLSEIIALPKITGTAVVVAVGNEMECIRSTGEAPPVGSRGCAGVGLTGICFSTGKVELCNDVENDSRADLQACADLGIRSVLVVPIRHSSRVTGVLEALSSKPNAFDWRTIRHIRRVARAFDPVTLKSSVDSSVRQDGFEQAASVSVQARTSVFDLQKVLYSALMVQKRFGASATASGPENRGHKFGEAQPDYQDRQCAFALQSINEQPCRSWIDPPALGAQEDAVPSFLRSQDEFPDKSRPRRFVRLAVALVILFVAVFEFRTHIASSGTHLNFAQRLPTASSQSSAAVSHKSNRNSLPTEPAPGSDLGTTKSAPRPRMAMPESSAGVVAKFNNPEQNDEAAASWQMALAYLKGVGVKQDEHEPAKWLKKAANLGDPRAQATLSDMYFRGVGVQRDYVRAYTWASIAAGQLKGEGERLAVLRQRMTRPELEDANRRIQTWFHAQVLSR